MNRKNATAFNWIDPQHPRACKDSIFAQFNLTPPQPQPPETTMYKKLAITISLALATKVGAQAAAITWGATVITAFSVNNGSELPKNNPRAYRCLQLD
jgi:hypothetical protein